MELSVGQKQRLAIARALLKRSSVLLLDEATSAMDSVTEHQVKEAIRNVSKGRTVLVVAHRLCTIRHADNIVVLGKSDSVDGGAEIVEQGTHEQLTRAGGYYAEFAKYQRLYE